jgi:hypothetical protein
VQDSLQQGSLPLYAKHVGNNGGLPSPQGRAVIGLQGLATKGGRKPLGFGVQIPTNTKYLTTSPWGLGQSTSKGLGQPSMGCKMQNVEFLDGMAPWGCQTMV